MKKQLKKGLAFLMVLMMVSVLGGCKDKQTEGTEAPTGTGAVTPVEPETLAPVVQIEDISVSATVVQSYVKGVRIVL